MMYHVWKHISLEDYNKIFDRQGGCCAICGIHQSQLDKKLSVDHDHETREIRGLLCNACNVGLGYFRDNEDRLASAIDYLQNSSTGIYLSERPISRKVAMNRETTTERSNVGDWRLLSDADAEWISSASVSNIMTKYSIGRSTAFDWKKRLD